MDFDDKDIASKARTVHGVAKAFSERCSDWVVFFREVMGMEGIVRKAFPTPQMLARFELTDEYADILRMFMEKREAASVHDHIAPARFVISHSDGDHFRGLKRLVWFEHDGQCTVGFHRCGVRLGCQVGEFSPTDEVADELANLCRAINAYHIACGGDGLVIDDWEVLVRRDVPQEVH